MFSSKLRGLIGFFAVSGLVLGGLGWATRVALRVEDAQHLSTAKAAAAEQLHQQQKDRADQLRLAMWRLDARLTPALAREDSRPYPHYVALHTPFPALTAGGMACAPGQVYLPSPLLTAELPEWMQLHFQVDHHNGWTSPQVITEGLQKTLRKQPIELALNNVTSERAQALKTLSTRFPTGSILTTFRELGVNPIESPEDIQRLNELNEIVNSTKPAGRNGMPFGLQGGGNGMQQQANPLPQAAQNLGNSINPDRGASTKELDFALRGVFSNRARRDGQWAYIFDDARFNFTPEQREPFMGKSALAFQTVEVQLGAMRSIWLPTAEKPEFLMLVRGAEVGGKAAYQGISVDWPKLKELLRDEVSDLFPDADFRALPPGLPVHPELTMTTIPVEFDPKVEPIPESLPPLEPSPAGWTPLRIGLCIAWVALLVALLGVGLGGWSLIDLSERRIRFVSAVTHELRTPLTTLRLYLDLLSSGMVTEEKQKAEYLTTLNCEADRLHRLIGNVLDFARLEKSRPNVSTQPMLVSDLLDQLQRNWTERCAAAGKDLVQDNRLPLGATIHTDVGLAEQVLSNLVDNAQKYSRDASDPRIILRAMEHEGRLRLEVEDRGPGVTHRERGSIFRPFRRGRNADVAAGGVGLGLALATRWAAFLGGKLSVTHGAEGVGACFRLDLPGPILSASPDATS